MADQSILREYLVALGFKIDKTENKKFSNTLISLDKSALNLGKSILGVATSAQAMAAVFAVQMEKLYYSSKRIGTTVGNLQALKYGASQIGISGEHMQSALEGVARSIRSNPGLAGLIQSFGIKVQGRDMADVAMDFVKTLNKMPPYIAERYAGLFGIDPDTLFQLRQGMAEMERAAVERKKLSADLGVDSEKAAKAGKEYAQQWREILMTVDLFKDAVSMALLPGMREMASITKEVLRDWIGIVQNWKGARDFWTRMAEGLTGRASGGGVKLSPEAQRRIAGGAGGSQEAPAAQLGGTTGAGPSGASSAGSGGSAGLFERLEKKYNLPPGLLDRIWAKESARGTRMLSPKGAQGHFQFMKKTAEQYGVKDPHDLAQSAEGAAHYMADLLKQNQGDLRAAAASYNWGIGNVKKFGLGAAPRETRDYMDAIAGGGASIQQTNHITVTGSSNPQEAAREVEQRVRQTNMDLVRQLKPRVY